MASHGRYTILKKLADGGMAELFLATQSGMAGFERKVVLKRILPALSADPQFRNLLVDEALIAMGLTHGNIVQVLDLGYAGARTFLVMELVDGWDLASVLARAVAARMPLPTEIGLYVLAEVCRGLFYAHSFKRDGRPIGIVHRDVSPQNILVSEQGEVKVTDFGIAKALGKSDKTQTGVIKGKLDFMSPEQAAGVAVDARTDIFSAGSVLYLAVTGHLPFPGKTPMETLLLVQGGRHVPVIDVAPALDPGAMQIIERAMAMRPTDRYQTAQEMMLDIERVLRNNRISVGQSDLKRWLDGLAVRDHTLPVSRQSGLPMRDDETQGLTAGSTFALDDTSAVAALAPTELHDPTGPEKPEQALPPPRAAPAFPASSERRSWFSFIGNGLAILVVLVSLGAATVYTVVPDLWRRLVTRSGDAISSTTEKLLKQARDMKAKTVRISLPERAERVMPVAARDRPERPPSTEPSPKPRPATAPPVKEKARVALDLRSVPTAANVEAPGRNLGRTPTRLLADVGDRLALRFSKTGYAPVTKTVTVGPDGGHLVVQLHRAKR